MIRYVFNRKKKKKINQSCLFFKCHEITHTHVYMSAVEVSNMDPGYTSRKYISDIHVYDLNFLGYRSRLLGFLIFFMFIQ